MTMLLAMIATHESTPAQPEHHSHAPGSHRGHGHAGRELGRRRLLLVLALTAAFTVAEFAGGWIANSLALIADAGHMLSDVGALALSVLALRFAQRPATPAKTSARHMTYRCGLPISQRR